ncbi:MAG: hypothetical protein JXC31_04430 [Acholeplasmataceae bacterium]|nr:hypothetical protein [Acholeplasmataceae bacterium]
MKKNSKEFFRKIKKEANQVVDSVKKIAEDAQEKVEIYQAFKKQAVKIKKITSERINLDMPIYGILDKNLESMTFRAKDHLETNELLMIDRNVYKVEYIHDEIIQVPVIIDGFEHRVECRVAVLARV